MNFLENPAVQKQLFPFTLTRAVPDIRIGIFTIREKWLLAKGTGFFTDVPSNLLPSPEVVYAFETGGGLADCTDVVTINYPWDIFVLNDRAIRMDFDILTRNQVSEPIPGSVQAINPDQIFIETGARLQHCILNASTGPIYIGHNAEVMEGSTIRGPFALCEGAVVKMGSRIYGATTIGPYSVVGGEIKNSVFFGYTNKAHDGYLGDSVIGEWCNLGGGTSTSNLKNNVGDIKIHNGETGEWLSAGKKCGLLMGDHCRSAVNTAFNTGTVTGVSCNIFGSGLLPKYIPSFSWGVTGGRYRFDKAFQDIANWMALKKHTLSEKEMVKLKYIYDHIKN